jgi:hypothetical protein
VSYLFKLRLKQFILFIFLIPVTVNAQILRDTASLKLVKKGIDNIYNLSFNDADEVCRKLNHLYPEHPIVYLLRGMITYWENYPLLPSSAARTLYENNMRRCIELSEGKYKHPDEAEYLLADLSARGMLLMFYADNNLTMEVIPLASGTYPYIMKSFDNTAAYNDFYFFTGLYNYYREAYPEAYPVYKAVAFLFPGGDKAKGIRELQSLASNSILFKAEASSFLSLIYLSFENNFGMAFNYSKSLHEIYPQNIQFLAMFIKNLLLIKQYDEAEKHILSSSETSIKSSYYQAQLSFFNGVLQEKKYHNYKLAEQSYLKGISEMSVFGHYGNEYAAYNYFGLSRVTSRNADKNNKKAYRKKAVELADFRNVNFD